MADVASGAGTTGDDKARTKDDTSRAATDRTRSSRDDRTDARTDDRTDARTKDGASDPIADPAVDGDAYTSAVRDGYGVTGGTDDDSTTGATTGRDRDRDRDRAEAVRAGTGTSTTPPSRSAASSASSASGAGESVVDEAKRRAATTGSDRATDASADTGRTGTGTTRTGTDVRGDDLAAGTRATNPPAPEHRPSGTAKTPATSTTSTSTTSTSTGAGSTSTSGAGLLAHDDGDKFSLRLQQAVTGFVDGPRDAVEEADHVLEEVAARFTDAVAERRRSLRTSWESGSKGGDTSSSETDTEKLRLALKDYRELTERLLHL